MRIVPALIVALSCTAEIPAAGPVVVESTGRAAVSVSAAPGHRLLTVADGGLWLEALGAAPAPIGDTPLPVVGAGALPDGALMLATEAEIGRFDGFFQPSPIADAVGGPFDALAVHGAEVWVAAAGSAWRWRDGQLAEVPLGAVDRLAGGGRVDGEAALWVAGPAGVAAWVERGDAYVEVLRRSGAARSLSTDGDGRLYALIGGSLLVWDHSGWVDLGWADAVSASPARPGAWLRRGDTIERVTPDGWRADAAGAVPGAGAVAADEVGRAYVIADGELLRLTAGVALAIGGLQAGERVTTPVEVAIAPSPLDAVAEVRWGIGAADTLADPADDSGVYRAVVDPAPLGAGTHTLAVEVRFTDGAVARADVPFTAAPSGPLTWTEHVEPLYDDRCAFCHDNGTETLLGSREAWIERFDDIVAELEAARMPLGGDPFTPAEINLVRGWADGGFLE